MWWPVGAIAKVQSVGKTCTVGCCSCTLFQVVFGGGVGLGRSLFC